MTGLGLSLDEIRALIEAEDNDGLRQILVCLDAAKYHEDETWSRETLVELFSYLIEHPLLWIEAE